MNRRDGRDQVCGYIINYGDRREGGLSCIQDTSFCIRGFKVGELAAHMATLGPYDVKQLMLTASI